MVVLSRRRRRRLQRNGRHTSTLATTPWVHHVHHVQVGKGSSARGSSGGDFRARQVQTTKPQSEMEGSNSSRARPCEATLKKTPSGHFELSHNLSPTLGPSLRQSQAMSKQRSIGKTENMHGRRKSIGDVRWRHQQSAKRWGQSAREMIQDEGCVACDSRQPKYRSTKP